MVRTPSNFEQGCKHKRIRYCWIHIQMKLITRFFFKSLSILQAREPRFCSNSATWARLYRWELFTYSVETVALATILAGAIQAILRPASKQAKAKKKVVLAPFLTSVPSFNQMLQALQDLADFLLSSLEVDIFIITTCLKRSDFYSFVWFFFSVSTFIVILIRIERTNINVFIGVEKEN